MLKKLFLVLAVVAVVLGGAALGLRLSPFLAVRLGFASFEQAAVAGEDVPATMLSLIGHAQRSIVLASEEINSRGVLDSLQEAGRRSVKVVVVLSGPSNTDPTKGALAWLNERRIPVETTVEPFEGTILVVDQRIGAISAQPIRPKEAFASDQSPLFVFMHSPTAMTFFERIKHWRKN